QLLAKLKRWEQIFHMVIEEVGVLQTQLEIEKSCRENAEALATKLNCENRKLKYLSLSSRPCLDELLPSISDCIALEADGDSADSVGNSPDTFSQCQQQVKELRETVNGLLEEKKGFVCQIHEQQRQIEELTTQQSEKSQEEMKQLRETVEQQSKTIKRFNRVSMMAAQEYEGMKEQLDLEQDLRVKAETYAHEMLVKQKEANRQSMLLLQSAEPSVQLLKALEDVAAITKTLEEERLQHQQKVQSLEAQLQESGVKKQLQDLQRQLELLEVEKKEVEGRLEQTERKNEELEKRVHELQEAQKKTTDNTSLPPPEPGVAPPPARCNPLSSLIAIMRKSSKGSKAKVEPTPVSAAAEGVDDVKVKAVNEMMERIKHGVVLRPVKSQETKLQPPPCEEKQQESAMDELKCILLKETVKRSPSRGSQESGPSGPSPPAKKDSELEVILRRRRNKAGEAGSGGEP
uniref:Si:dkey-280e21.3 n=1 Tax=Poecilia formosa TaxID=48698 RepID=A0A087XP83_POEFO